MNGQLDLFATLNAAASVTQSPPEDDRAEPETPPKRTQTAEPLAGTTFEDAFGGSA